MRWLTSLADRSERFWFGSPDLRALDRVRIGLSLCLLVEFALLWPHVPLLYGPNGLAPLHLAPHWIQTPFLGSVFLHLRSDTAVHAIYAVFLLGLGCLLLGWQTRWAKLVVWALHLSLYFRNQNAVYGADRVVSCALFLLVLAPIGRHYALDARHRRWDFLVPERASVVGRVLKLQLLVLYAYAGLGKLRFDHWWRGDAIWRALVNPEFGSAALADWFAQHAWLGAVLTHLTLVAEISYPFLVFQARLRPWVVLGMMALHAGIAVVLGLVYFSGVMIAVNLVWLTESDGLRAAFAELARCSERQGPRRMKREADQRGLER